MYRPFEAKELRVTYNQSVTTAVTSVTYKRTTARYMVTELRLCHMLSVNNKTRRDTKCVHTSALENHREETTFSTRGIVWSCVAGIVRR